MGRFTVIPQDTFNEIQTDAGVVLSSFDPSNPVLVDSAIITATTGGIQISCTPTFSDLGEDVDNCPNNTKEMKHLDGWDCKLSTTAISASPEVIRIGLGAADITAASSKITPRKDLSQGDFADLWWVGDRSDGGLVAVKIINALGTEGFSLQTTKNGKGQISLGLTGHVSINAQSVMPMEFYSIAAPTVTLNKSTETVTVNNTVTLTATTVPAGETVTWASSDTDKATVADGVVTGKAAGTATITATVTGGNSASCVVTVNAGA